VLAVGGPSLGAALVLRFFVGVCLAGVYPPAMKLVAGHVSERARGLAMGVLVGAVTVLVKGPELDASVVLLSSSALAVLGCLLVAVFVVEGPYARPSAPFDPRQIGRVLRNRALLLANFGYCGHMWELYGMWTWVLVFLSSALASEPTSTAQWLAFISIGVFGCIGAVLGGMFADRIGRTMTTMVAMLVSGACCLATPWIYDTDLAIMAVFSAIWGVSIIADSAQFSAAVTELAHPDYVGTAIALQTGLGFLVTLAPIWTLPWLAETVGWRWVFVVLAPGPLLGTWAMARLREHRDAIKLAGGRR